MTRNREWENYPTALVLARRIGEMIGRPEVEAVAAEWLRTPLTHPSYTFETGRTEENNQRLEFLGDAVLNFLVGEYLYLHYPDRPEGELTKIRAAVVNETTLARVARQLDLGLALRLGRGELYSGGRLRDSNLADALEALIGALYLRFGLESARLFVRALLAPEIEALPEAFGDHKTRLQEMAQKQGLQITYQVTAEHGPAHRKIFTVAVLLDGQPAGAGSGRTKKEAEQRAAGMALLRWLDPA
ncbi:MAG: ribonuclease III [Gracilibacteraceae bacterium]|jgi:ribonuclease-3|nr:ribonuclease III [Gracilibacteraceae bacterium]